MINLITKLVLKPVAKALYRPVIEGLENVPRDGGVILASNHLSFIDSVVIPLTAPRRVYFLAKAEYFTGTGLKGALSRALFNALNAVPVERGDIKTAQAALDSALEILHEGKAFGIYPEGTRSLDGRLYRGKTGVAWLALTAGVPVVPVALEGPADILPVGKRIPRLRKVTVRFGEPLHFDELHGQARSARARREVTDQVMAAIHQLSGQELAEVYNERPMAA
ncbi:MULTISPECIES: 1-acyl-sn-glycerol-3-phosphate acyltransferase [unclassified Kitasatospora]|uniref:lysophospholipid acyltransferase family protein n=1 Tax=unclassified Kitasatospora TaxID=2633591 RepID=UPI00070BD934|nr:MULTISPECIES: lysophospholipid acyltransferase family protein [unclassified Kitasatospora]KQV04591.1 acyl-phosphate glycerol 3-phosphate acyltransferase [Kitasatospora sp. Root107]KRB60882.1 acyl-phosphate glycerol 3-phosphate acyltransferase [Kitasatospora sp. Root187]